MGRASRSKSSARRSRRFKLRRARRLVEIDLQRASAGMRALACHFGAHQPRVWVQKGRGVLGLCSCSLVVDRY